MELNYQMNIKNFKDFESSSTTPQLLVEIKQNLIYKNFKRNLNKPLQLPLPFQFSDEFFESKKEQVNHILRTMNFMKIGFEFEIYLPKHIDDEGGGYVEAETTDLSEYSRNYFNVLRNYFYNGINEDAYFDLKQDFLEWQSDKISGDIEDRMKEDDIDPDDFDDHRDEYLENMEDEYDFDEYINDEFGGRLIKAVHRFNFTETKYGYGFNDYGDIIIEPEFYENEEELSEEDHHENLKEFLSGKLDSPVLTSSYNKNYDTTWYISEDASLSGREPDDDYFAVEVISKKYPASQWKKLFLSTLSLFEEYGKDSPSRKSPKTNSKTGLHFGVSFDDGRKINLLKLVVLGQDSFWAKKVNREFNSYCSSQVKHLLEKLQNISKSDVVTAKVNELKGESIEKAADYIIDELDKPIKHEKYTSINFTKDDYIEFRLAGNDYYNKFRKNNMEIIEWFIYILVAAASSSLWEKEYKQWIVSKFDSFVSKLQR